MYICRLEKRSLISPWSSYGPSDLSLPCFCTCKCTFLLNFTEILSSFEGLVSVLTALSNSVSLWAPLPPLMFRHSPLKVLFPTRQNSLQDCMTGRPPSQKCQFLQAGNLYTPQFLLCNLLSLPRERKYCVKLTQWITVLSQHCARPRHSSSLTKINYRTNSSAGELIMSSGCQRLAGHLYYFTSQNVFSEYK